MYAKFGENCLIKLSILYIYVDPNTFKDAQLKCTVESEVKLTSSVSDMGGSREGQGSQPMKNHKNIGFLSIKIASEYAQKIPQSQTADNPVAPRGRAAQPSRDTRKTN